jgi:hypothetical protein
MVEVIGFNGAFPLAADLIGEGGIPEPPTPPRASADMDPHLSGDAPRCTRVAQQKGGEHPVHERALAADQERACEVMEGALAGLLLTAVASQSRLVMVRPPRTDVVALTARTLEWAIFPPQHMDVGLTRFGVEEVVQMRRNRHG